MNLIRLATFFIYIHFTKVPCLPEATFLQAQKIYGSHDQIRHQKIYLCRTKKKEISLGKQCSRNISTYGVLKHDS